MFCLCRRPTTAFMTWIKICGITNLEDALTAVDAGANALGFVFYDKSPRKVEPATVRDIIEHLPEHIETVGVFVDADGDHIRDVVSQTGLTSAQLHGRQSLQSLLQDSRQSLEHIGVSKVIPAVPGDSLKEGGVLITQNAREKIFALLLDAQSNGMFGGTGTTFDWKGTRAMVQVISLQLPIIVAGGLTALNVSEAIRILQPFGVDVSSGVEASRGKKDPERIRAFIEAVHHADKRV
jgi:phosphoribosylanthranilate isomerase